MRYLIIALLLLAAITIGATGQRMYDQRHPIIVHSRSPFGQVAMGVDTEGNAEALRITSDGRLLARCLTDREVSAGVEMVNVPRGIVGTMFRNVIVDKQSGIALVKCED